MITRWEEIVKRTAENLGASYEEVLEIVMNMTLNTEKHLSHPNLLETDLLGLGHLEIRYGKAIKRIPYLKGLIHVKRMYADRCRLRAYPEDLIKADKFEADIKILERDIDFFNEVIRIKQDIYNSGGKKNYIKIMMGDDLKCTDIVKRKKKIYLNPLSKKIGRKKGSKDVDKRIRPKKKRLPE